MATILDADIANRYRLVRSIGAGGAGTVYQAADLLLGRTVAVKVLHGHLGLDLLRSEGRSLARLQHPNVVALHDLVLDGDQAFLIMEYVEGCDLERWLTDRGSLSLDAALDVFRHVALAIAHAHAHGLLHCDLKPANILVSRSGEIKLTDFTLGHTREDRRFIGTAGGTLEYAAPEQMRGASPDERTDIYGLGALLRRILRAVDTDNPEGQRVAAVAICATASEPDERFRSVADLLDALPAAEVGATRIVPVSISSEFTRISAAPSLALGKIGLPGGPPRGHPGAGPYASLRAHDFLRSNRRLWPLLSIPLVLVVAIVALWVHLSASASPTPVVLPSLVSIDSHSAQLVARSFTLHPVLVWRYSATTPTSIVMEQQPGAGVSVARGSTVTLIVSRGPHPILVPDLRGLSESDAMAKLRSLGFHIVEQNQDQAFGSTNTILDQAPTPGSSVLPHSVVTLTVSRAPWWEFWRSG